MANDVVGSFQNDSWNGLSRASHALAISTAALFVFSILVTALLSGALALLIIFGGMIFLGVKAFELMSAKSRALQEKDVSIWNGFARIITWNPTEGVLFLKNKQVCYLDDDPNDGGGISIIFPILGEELAARVPLEIQTTPFEDSNILTKEFIPLSIKATILWKIVDLNRFYLSMSREVHSRSDRGDHVISGAGRNAQFETAERWLCSMMEEETRAIVSRVGTGLLISDRLMSDLPTALPAGEMPFLISGPESSESYRSATDSLADAVASTVGGVVTDYGLEVHRVTLQQVNMPPEIYAAAVDACRSAYAPLKAKADAIAERMRLQAGVDVLGVEAAGLREIAGNVPALAIQDFLGPLFLQYGRNARPANA